MQLSTQDGVICDQCSDVYCIKFTYYSYDFKEVIITNGRRPSLDSILAFDTVKSLDVCGKCHKDISYIILSNQPAKINQCELTKEILNNLSIYCVVAKVNVDLNIGNSVEVNNRHLEFFVSPNYFEQMLNKAEASKAKNVKL